MSGLSQRDLEKRQVCAVLWTEVPLWNAEFEMPVCSWEVEEAWEWQSLERSCMGRRYGCCQHVGVVGWGEVALRGCVKPPEIRGTAISSSRPRKRRPRRAAGRGARTPKQRRGGQLLGMHQRGQVREAEGDTEDILMVGQW